MDLLLSPQELTRPRLLLDTGVHCHTVNDSSHLYYSVSLLLIKAPSMCWRQRYDRRIGHLEGKTLITRLVGLPFVRLTWAAFLNLPRTPDVQIGTQTSVRLPGLQRCEPSSLATASRCGRNSGESRYCPTSSRTAHRGVSANPS